MNATASSITSSDIIVECLQDLNSQSQCLTITEFKYAKQTIMAIGILLKKKERICSLLNETQRNSKITNLTKLIAEPGLVPGTTKEEIEKSIMSRVDLLKTAFLFDREKDETILLYKKGFIGPPCFNGRVITLQHYVLLRQGIKTDLFYDYNTPIDDPAIQLEEIMYSCVESLKLDRSTPPSLERIRLYSAKQPEVFNNALIDINSGNIQAIYNRACEFYVE